MDIFFIEHTDYVLRTFNTIFFLILLLICEHLLLNLYAVKGKIWLIKTSIDISNIFYEYLFEYCKMH